MIPTPKYGKLDSIKKAEWIAALRYAGYKQITHTLYDLKTDRFCCIGVYFKAVKGERTGSKTERCFPDLKFEWPDILTADGVNALGRDHLVQMNDGGSSFEQIADWIEQNL